MKSIIKVSAVFGVIALFLFTSFCIARTEPPPENRTQDQGLNDRINKDDSAYWPGKVRLSALGSSEDRGIFYIDYLFPLYYSQDQTAIVFLNPKQNLFTPYGLESNLGGGVRKVFCEKYILGAHFFYDKKYSRKHKLYSQVGYGVEFLSQPFDFRFNFYDPKTKAKVVEDAGYALGETNLLHFSIYEEPLEGYDFELGFPMIPKELKSRLYFGGFFFDSKLAKDVNGYRLRSETDINKWLAMDMVFNNRNAGESEFIGGLRVTLPFEWARIIDRKNPFKPMPRDTYIKERLFERVVRDIDVQTQGRGTARAQSQSDVGIIYVDNSNEGAQDGTLTHPYTTLAAAVADARFLRNLGSARYIYVFPGSGNYNDNFTFNDGEVLWGSASNGGFSGLATTAYPVISSGGDVITMANNNIVQGLQIQDGTNGIYAENRTAGIIRDNFITENSSRGIFLVAAGGVLSDFTITGNTISGNSGPLSGIDIMAYVGGVSGLTISDNVITGNNGDGIAFMNFTGDMSDFTIAGNTITNNAGSGISFETDGYYYGAGGDISAVIISNNEITDNTVESGISFLNSNGTISGFTIAGNTLSRNALDGITLINGYYGTPGLVSDFSISGNTIEDNVTDGIAMINVYGAVSDFAVSGNTISGSETGALLLNIYGAFSNMDFGGGALNAPGRNSIFNNESDIDNITGDPITAINNYWGPDNEPVTFGSEVIYLPVLTTDPNP